MRYAGIVILVLSASSLCFAKDSRYDFPYSVKQVWQAEQNVVEADYKLESFDPKSFTANFKDRQRGTSIKTYLEVRGTGCVLDVRVTGGKRALYLAPAAKRVSAKRLREEIANYLKQSSAESAK